MNNSVPKWITIVSTLITLLALFVGLSLYVSPGAFFEGVDFSSAGALFAASMWAARQIAIAAIIGYSLLKQSNAMLQVSLIAFALLNIQDVFIGVSMRSSELIFGSIFFFMLSASMIFVLARKSA